MPESPYWSAAGVLEDLGIYEPSDIDIEAIAQYCGATVMYEPLSGCAASILGRDGKAFITVDKGASRGRQRFSAAHELGHWMYDRGRTSLACTDRALAAFGEDTRREVRANRYAVDLLLPQSMFEPRAHMREATFDSVRLLADLFGTSLTSTAIRLVELGSYPAMLVLVEDGRSRWSVRGPCIPSPIRPLDAPGRESVAHELSNGGRGETASVDVGAENWIDHPNASEYSVREHSIRISETCILSLVWWKSERQLLDLDEDDE